MKPDADMSPKAASKADVLQGTLDLMVLQTLDVLGPSHGYAIASRLEQVSKGALQLNMGTLYPALMRLEQRGLLRGAWGTTDNNRRARFYNLTAAGRRELASEKQAWDRMTAIMQALLGREAEGCAHSANGGGALSAVSAAGEPTGISRPSCTRT